VGSGAQSESCAGAYCSPQPVAFYVNGDPYTGDPRAIELTDRKRDRDRDRHTAGADPGDGRFLGGIAGSRQPKSITCRT
jgi:hypothetical protein